MKKPIVLNRLVLAYQKWIADAMLASLKKRGPANKLGGLVLSVRKAKDPREIHNNYSEGHYENAGRKYPYRSVKRGGNVIPA